MAQARQQGLQTAAAVAEGDAQVRKARQREDRRVDIADHFTDERPDPVLVRQELADVATGTEHLARPREHDDAGVGRGNAAHRFDHVVAAVQADRVCLVGPVEGQPADAVRDAPEKCLVHGFSASFVKDCD